MTEEGRTLPTCEHERTGKDCAACVWRLHIRAQQHQHDNFVAILTEALRYVEAGDGHGPVVLRDALARLDRPYGAANSRTLDSQRGAIVGLTLALQEACRDDWADGEGAMKSYLRPHGVAYSLLPVRPALFARQEQPNGR